MIVDLNKLLCSVDLVREAGNMQGSARDFSNTSEMHHSLQEQWQAAYLAGLCLLGAVFKCLVGDQVLQVNFQ